MGMASSPTSLVFLGTGCAMPSTNAVVMLGTVVFILAFILSFSPLSLTLDRGWQLSVRQDGASSAARGAVRNTAWVFLST